MMLRESKKGREKKEMLFHSLEFFVFFPVVVLVYFIIPKKLKALWLLAASYYFYMCWNPKHLLLIACCTVVSWISGLLLGRCKRAGRRAKWIAAGSIFFQLGVLVFFKYAGFILQNINAVLEKMGVVAWELPFSFALPAGISFYTFQALGYTIDVYRGEVEPEKNLCSYALFVAFFPQLVAGPIERSKNLLGQMRGIREKKIGSLFDYDRIAQGLMLMLWGFFLKLVIADRICILVDTVYHAWELYGTVELVVATAAFSIQIYCDFAGYSTIARGAAMVMGFTLMENFRAPYFSKSIREFWRRWHISLSTWFKDYLYIPLGGSRRGTVRTYLNLMIVFLASGLWHGASWHYAAWGGIHGVYQAVGTMTDGMRKRLRKRAGTDTRAFSFRLGQVLVTYALSLFGLIFFRADSFTAAVGICKRILTKLDPWVLVNGGLLDLGLEGKELVILFAALSFLLFFSLVREYRNETPELFLHRQSTWFRWLLLVILFSFLFLFGMYGPEYDESQFIYFQF